MINDTYRWHNLRENPKDLPELKKPVIAIFEWSKDFDITWPHNQFEYFLIKIDKTWLKRLTDGYLFYDIMVTCVAWRYLDLPPFLEEAGEQTFYQDTEQRQLLKETE